MVWVDGEGSGCSSCTILPCLPCFLQDIGPVIPLQSTGSGFINGELQASGWKPAALNSSTSCWITTAQDHTELLKWGCSKPSQNWRFVLELFTVHEGFRSWWALCWPCSCFQQQRPVGRPPTVLPREVDPAIRGYWQKHRLWGDQSWALKGQP